MTSGGLGYYTWQDYPPDVPLDRRRPCIECGAPGEVVRYQHVDRFGFQVAPADEEVRLGDPTAADGFAVFCRACARAAGWDSGTDHSHDPVHLNAVQRWLGRLLDYGDPNPIS